MAPFTNLVLGSDLVAIPRVLASYRRFGTRFLSRFLTPAELHACQTGLSNPHSPRYAIHIITKAAARIAAKEAVSKALGVGISGIGWDQGVSWQEIEVLSEPQAPPQLKLTGKAFQVAQSQGIQDWKISLTHDGDYAMATVIGLCS